MTRTEATRALRVAGIEQPAREARLLLAAALDLSLGMLPDPQTPVPSRFGELVRRRVAREPMARIVGRQGFWTLDLLVSDATLIPRADTETLIEATLAARPDRSGVRSVVDLGTGTGALLLAALAEYPRAFGIGIDSSVAACVMARCNANLNGLAARALFACANWAAPLAGKFDLVLCNPPYIPRADIPNLMPEVALFEPARALDGGADGLDCYRVILPQLPSLLAPQGMAAVEHGAGQGDAVAAVAEAAGLRVFARPRDLGGVERALMLDDSG